MQDYRYPRHESPKNNRTPINMPKFNPNLLDMEFLDCDIMDEEVNIMFDERTTRETIFIKKGANGDYMMKPESATAYCHDEEELQMEFNRQLTTIMEQVEPETEAESPF